MEGLVMNQTEGDGSSRRSTRNSPKKLNPKRKKTDTGSRQNRLGRTFSTENPSPAFKEAPIAAPPPNLPQKLTPQPSPALKAKQKRPVTRNPGGSVQEFSGGAATLGTNKRTDLLVPSAGPLGPDPSDLPTELVGIFRSIGVAGEKRSGSALFLLSPPPSSLPLPKFSVKQKASCRSEATAGGVMAVDSGATVSLRRLLHLP
ncbi:uncharacterized protein LOC126409767 [Nymphaea colorata]|nr:uncharacterized protein LOC126409767 [Nymphaea colorata]